MTGYGLLFDYLWIAPHVLQAFVAAIMIRRKLVLEFPAFFAYTVVELLQFSVLVYRGMWDTHYVTLYLVGSVISCLLRFAVLYGIFAHLFRDYPAVSGLGRVTYRWSASILLLVSVAVIASTAGETKDYLAVWVYIVDRGVSIIQCGLLMVLFAMSRFLRFSWRNHAFGIALGLGLFASAELAVAAIRAQLPQGEAFRLLNYLTMGTYHVCVLIWAIYLWAPEREYRTAITSVPENVLENWDVALQRVLER